MDEPRGENRTHADVAVNLTEPTGGNAPTTVTTVQPVANQTALANSSPTSIVKSQQSPSSRSRQDTIGIAIIVIGVVILLAIHTLLGRLLGGDVDLRRLPEHRFDFRIDINSANEVELQHLPGIGPALAARIVDDRTRNGPFNGIVDLRRVKGIGTKTLDALRPYLVDPPAPRPAPKSNQRIDYRPPASTNDI
jgi:competence protein ComEA